MRAGWGGRAVGEGYGDVGCESNVREVFGDGDGGFVDDARDGFAGGGEREEGREEEEDGGGAHCDGFDEVLRRFEFGEWWGGDISWRRVELEKRLLRYELNSRVSIEEAGNLNVEKFRRGRRWKKVQIFSCPNGRC